MTLRTRLFLALLLLALAPTALFTLFTLQALGGATERWFRPGVEHALESALEVSRTSLTRIEAIALQRTDAWAAELAAPPLEPVRRAELRDGLRTAGLDFAQVYVRARGAWRLAEQVVPAGVLAADSLDLGPELDAALAGSRLLRSRRGALAAVARVGDRAALVAGVRLTPDYWQRLGQVGTARELYGRLGVVVSVQQLYVWLLVAALVLVVVTAAAWAARALAREMTRPLAALAAGFERVAGGDLEARLAPSGARELRRLAEAFNAMTTRLAEARVALATAEREAAWREVARQLAHEIRNPLTPMRLSLHRLQRRAGLVPEDQRAAVQDSLAALLEEVEHLARLAEQFAQYARLPEPRFEPLDLAALARAAAALHEPEGVHVRVDGDGPVPVRGDRLLLSRAVHNLLLNACEASPPGAEVEVRTGRDGGEGWIEILDRGPGLPAELAGRLFEPYVSTKNRGSGLGLSLVRDVAQQHHGRVALEGREGGGARARLALPLADDVESHERT